VTRAKPRLLERQIDVYGAFLYLARSAADVGLARERFPGIHELDHAMVGGTTPILDTEDPLAGFHVIVYIDVAANQTRPGVLINTIAHESAHAAGMILDHFGQPYDGDSEAHAYLVGWIAEWLWVNVS
jgi:hypothetical protein